MRHCLPLIARSLENKWVTGESRSTGRAERTSVREHLRPSQTHAEEVVVNAPGENFPVALRLLPARHRRHLTNLYFFARLTDDLGDEARDLLGRRRHGTPAALAGRAWPPTSTASTRHRNRSPRSCRRWRRPVRECGVPAQPLHDLIEANRRTSGSPATRVLRPGAVLRAVRQPVGRLVLYIFGVATPERIALSDDICTPCKWRALAGRGRGPRQRTDLPAGRGPETVRCTEADLAAPAAT